MRFTVDDASLLISLHMYATSGGHIGFTVK